MLPMMLPVASREIKCRPYRSARVADVFLRLDRNTLEMQKYEQELATAAKVMPDNHVVYEIATGDNIVYVFVSDFRVSFGMKLIEGGW